MSAEYARKVFYWHSFCFFFAFSYCIIAQEFNLRANMSKALKIVSISLIAGMVLSLLAGCQERVFGVKEEVWSTMSEKERGQVIEGYNQSKQKELENERLRQELEAKNAPITAAASVLSALVDRNSKHEKSSYLKISSVSRSLGTTYLSVGGTKFEVSPFEDGEIDRWFAGQQVKIGKSDDLMYDISIHNLDFNETVEARKINH